ncbi:MAG: ATP-binding protein [Lysobacteraceae bacterium]
MRSLFWRIFFSLWLGSTLLLVGTSLLIAVIAEKEVPRQAKERVRELLRSNARALLELHGRIDERRFAATVVAAERDYGLEVFFIDDAGRELLGRPLPAGLRELADGIGDGRKTLEGRAPPFTGSLVFGERMRAADGRRYRVLISAAGPPLPSINFVLGTMITPLMLSVFLAGFFSAISAKFLVAPIEHLRRAARQIASGRLEARVGSPLRERTDEFGALAVDFDRMADRIGALIGTQRQLMLDLSHELRSPLARMRVALELMRDQPRGELLERMERDASRLDVLIGELLLLARLESPESALPATTVDIGELLGEIVDDARLEIAGQARTLRFDEATQDARVEGDRELLRRAFENVIRNALQHTPADADVTVSLQRTHGEVTVHVLDRGGGFGEMLPHVFAPFTRGDSPRQRQGNGLGLAIARAAVHRHGGTIEIADRTSPSGGLVVIHLPAHGPAGAQV